MRKYRFEAKYQLPLQSVGPLKDYIRPFMQPDEHAACDGQSPYYEIRSIYFDTRTFDYFTNHVEGHPTRKKIRLRQYAVDGQPEYFLEIKNKIYLVTQKLRSNVSSIMRQNPSAMRFSNFLNHIQNHPSDESAFEILKWDHTLKPLHPVILISYKRMAFKSLYEDDVRLTIDYDIQASKVIDTLHFQHAESTHPLLNNFIGVLELKCNRTMPSWMKDILTTFNLPRTAFSKYLRGISSLYNL